MTSDEYALYKSLGMCPDCGGKAEAGKVFCFSCNAYRLEIQKEARANGYRKPCEKTGEKRKYRKLHYERLKAQGICPYCGRHKAQEGKVACIRCKAKRSQYSKEQAWRKKQREG